MPKQDSRARNIFNYGDNPSLAELAVENTAIGLKALYEHRAAQARKKNPNAQPKRIPPDEVIEKMARFLKKSSIKNGSDDHLGTAEPRP